MKVETIQIMKHCSHDGCRKVAVVAEKISDFWATRCEEHRQKWTMGADSMERLSQVNSSPKKSRRAA